MTRKQKAERKQECIETLREICPPGTTVYTVLRHVSASGMSRLIDCYIIADNKPRWISSLVAGAIEATFDTNKSAIRVGGCGMDMGFHIVHSLSYALHPQGFDCIGDRCCSNEHHNGDRDYSPHHHRTAGYSLRHEWM